MKGASLKGKANPNATGGKKRIKIVELNKEFGSFKDCADFLKVRPHTISKYFQGEVKTVKGYTLVRLD